MLEGIVQVLFVLALSVLGPTDLDPLPPDQVLLGMADDCEVMLFADTRGGSAGISALLDDLAGQPFVAGSGEAMRAIEQIRELVEEIRGQTTASLGLDPLTQLDAVGLCARLELTGLSQFPQLEFVIVVQGGFSRDVTVPLADTLGLDEMELPGGEIGHGNDNMGVVSPRDGLLVVASHSYLADRIAEPLPSSFPDAAPDALVTRVSELLAQGARGYVALQPSMETRAFAVAGESLSMSELLGGLNRAILLWDATSAYLEVHAASDEAFRDYEYVIVGLRHLVEASAHLVHGYASLFLGLLSPEDPELGQFIRLLVEHRDDVMAFLEGQGLITDAQVLYAANPTERSISLTTRTARPAALIAAIGLGVTLALSADADEMRQAVQGETSVAAEGEAGAVPVQPDDQTVPQEAEEGASDEAADRPGETEDADSGAAETEEETEDADSGAAETEEETEDADSGAAETEDEAADEAEDEAEEEERAPSRRPRHRSRSRGASDDDDEFVPAPGGF